MRWVIWYLILAISLFLVLWAILAFDPRNGETPTHSKPADNTGMTGVRGFLETQEETRRDVKEYRKGL